MSLDMWKRLHTWQKYPNKIVINTFPFDQFDSGGLQKRKTESQNLPIMINANQSTLKYDTKGIFLSNCRDNIHDPQSGRFNGSSKTS